MKLKNTRICSKMILLLTLTTLFLPNSGFSATLFFDDFESGLGQWATVGSGVIVNDPLNPNNHVLTFTKLWSHGDILSRVINSTTGRYILSFDYLGTCSSKNCGGFIGYEPGDVWIGGSDSNYPDLLVVLPDTGRWEKVIIVFSGPTPISLQLEDHILSGGVPGDAYFDNILLTDAFTLFLPVVYSGTN